MEVGGSAGNGVRLGERKIGGEGESTQEGR